MRDRTTAALVIVVALCASSCVPWPHQERQTPEVRGTLTVAGTPLSGARIRVATIEEQTGSACSGKQSLEAMTNAEGRFQVEAIKKRHFVSYMVMAHRFYEWEACVQQGDAWVVLFRDKRYTLVGVPGAGPPGIFQFSCAAGSPKDAFECKPSYDSP